MTVAEAPCTSSEAHEEEAMHVYQGTTGCQRCLLHDSALYKDQVAKFELIVVAGKVLVFLDETAIGRVSESEDDWIPDKSPSTEDGLL